MLKQIISGGQTGVDRAALDAASAAEFPCGGWCPRGRRAEDGPVSFRYPLTETASADYSVRTEWNVRDADGTLILARGALSGGTALTRRLAERYEKPVFVVDLNDPPEPSEVLEWLQHDRIRVLNVAGPREQGCPGIYHQASEYLRSLLTLAQ